MKTEWTITKDHITDGVAKAPCNANAVGLVGPRSAKMTAEQIIAHDDATLFRLYDDDGILYYEGVMVGDNELAPLDQFGEPNAGCTSVKVSKTGQMFIQA